MNFNSSKNIINENEKQTVPELILLLSSHLAKNNEGDTAKLFKVASDLLSKLDDFQPILGENILLAIIKQYIISKYPENHGKCYEKFELLYACIKQKKILKHLDAVLEFLLYLAQNQEPKESIKWTCLQDYKSYFPPQNKPALSLHSKSNTTLNSIPSQESIQNIYQGISRPTSGSSHCESTLHTNVPTSSIWSRRDFGSSASSKSSNVTLLNEIDLIQDVIYALQGIDGKYLKKEPGSLGFAVDVKANRGLNPLQHGLLVRLLSMSFLHNQLKQYCADNDKQQGTMCQALISTLRNELSSYYRTIAMLQASLSTHNCSGHVEMSLRRVLFVIHEHKIRFEWLAYIAEECFDKKGGALITAIHGFLQHGSKSVKEVAERVLTSACKPLYIILSRWLLNGEITDPCNEFFIEVRTISTSLHLWRDKYHVRESMRPSFLSINQASKILAIGKSINFLRQVCKDNGQLPGNESLQKLFKNTTANSLFSPEESIALHETLDIVYRETSLRVLNLLKNKFNLLENLQALRKYLLLGQGDFIRHLLELLAPELSKPAQDIYEHTLTTLLEHAIRVTNARFDDENTLKRLTVSLLGHSQGDMGWDVFTITYLIDGPISTVFQPTMPIYHCLFGALWKAKRMEFILSNLRKQQLSISKLFKHNMELKAVMHSFHILTSEMVHFLHQTQYYFLFEVLETSWAEMLSKINHAECLDDVIKAHCKFLNSVQSGVLLDNKSKHLFSQLRSIYNFILNLETHQESLYNAVCKEHNAQIELKKKLEQNAVTLNDELADKERAISFRHFLNSMKATVKCLAQTYTSFIKIFLKALSSSSDMNLQLLSVRLNFNNYYSNE